MIVSYDWLEVIADVGVSAFETGYTDVIILVKFVLVSE